MISFRAFFNSSILKNNLSSSFLTYTPDVALSALIPPIPKKNDLTSENFSFNDKKKVSFLVLSISKLGPALSAVIRYLNNCLYCVLFEANASKGSITGGEETGLDVVVEGGGVGFFFCDSWSKSSFRIVELKINSNLLIIVSSISNKIERAFCCWK